MDGKIDKKLKYINRALVVCAQEVWQTSQQCAGSSGVTCMRT